ERPGGVRAFVLHPEVVEAKRAAKALRAQQRRAALAQRHRFLVARQRQELAIAPHRVSAIRKRLLIAGLHLAVVSNEPGRTARSADGLETFRRSGSRALGAVQRPVHVSPYVETRRSWLPSRSIHPRRPSTPRYSPTSLRPATRISRAAWCDATARF